MHDEGGSRSAMGMHSDKKEFSLRMPGDSGRTASGRISAPPMMNYSSEKSLLDMSRRSMDKSKSKLTKKRPEIFVLEAEQVPCLCVCVCMYIRMYICCVCIYPCVCFDVVYVHVCVCACV
jgi:hypothetical protein